MTFKLSSAVVQDFLGPAVFIRDAKLDLKQLLTYTQNPVVSM
jgi:hypothetical protein